MHHAVEMDCNRQKCEKHLTSILVPDSGNVPFVVEHTLAISFMVTAHAGHISGKQT
jgi:hypothetical protein